MRTAILCVLLCRGLAAQNAASIDGIVLDTTTHKPLSGVHINMRAGGLDAYGAISDKDGRFSVARIPPDVYLFSAQRNGYVLVPGKGVAADIDGEITLSAGEHLNGFIVDMSPRAAIAGRVTDEFGDPVQNAHVEAVPADLRRNSAVFGMDADSDERGQYRMAGLPGAYYIKVSNSKLIELVSAVRPSDASPAYAATWYPSVAGKDQARAVEAAAGNDVTGIDIRMVRAVSLSISGVVTGQGDHSASVMIRLAEEDGDPFFSSRKIVMVGPDGKFRVPGLAPGRYVIAAFEGDDTLRSPRAEVSLQSVDESGLVLNLAKGEEVYGNLKIEGVPSGVRPDDHLTVRLEPIGESTQPKGGDVDRDGAFRIERVFPAGFRVSVVPLADNAYVKSVKLDGIESPSRNLDFTRGVRGAKVDIVIGPNGGQVEGVVTDADGKVFDNPRPFVALANTPEDIRGDTIDRAEAGGQFRFTGVRPGKYRLVAIVSREGIRDHAVLEKAFSEASEFEVREGARIMRDVKIAADVKQ